jgi:hypothetical protein
MTPDECRAITERVREMLARARYLAGRSAAVQATAAELTVIADDLCFRARAERERAQELATERLRRHDIDGTTPATRARGLAQTATANRGLLARGRHGVLRQLTFACLIRDLSPWSAASLPCILRVSARRERELDRTNPRVTGIAAGRLRSRTARRLNGDP